MTHHHTAKGLASLGRHGDTVLVHMSPEEVHGLEAIARMHGTKLTRNPETGMPEAFSLGGFFKSLLPTIGGIAASAMFPEASPWLIGTLAGVGTTLATGNPLAGIMTGLGVGGGMGIGKGIFNVGDKLASTAGSEVAESVAANETAKQAAAATAGQGVSPLVNNPTMIAQQAHTASVLPNYTQAMSPYTNPAFNTATMQAPTSAVVGQNLKTFGSGLKESFSNPSALFKELGGGTQAAYKLGTPLVTAAASGLEPSDLGYDTATGQPTAKPIDINKPLNLNFNTGLKLMAEGGNVQSYAVGGNVSNQSVGAGLSDLYNVSDGTGTPNISQDGYGIGRLASLAREQSMNEAKTTGYAEGGSTKADTITDASNLDKLPTLNVNTGENRYAPNPNTNEGINALLARLIKGDVRSFNGFSPIRVENTTVPNPITVLGQLPGLTYKPMARGGYLDGQGDGMSDSIPATIEGKQPARLADGEFVVPADVVSHLGNGSSKAGSKRLYSMLDKVRKARTGHTKQGKQINPEKYMPA